MLSGWKMLATHCPLCNSALLQKELKVQCASCNMPVMTQEQYDLRDETNSVRNESNVSIDVSPLSECIAKSRREQEQLQRGKEEQLQRDGLLDLSAEKKNPKVIDLERTLVKGVSNHSDELSKTRPRDSYEGYYSDNDNIGETNTLEAEKKIYDLNNKKRDLTSAKLGERKNDTI